MTIGEASAIRKVPSCKRLRLTLPYSIGVQKLSNFVFVLDTNYQPLQPTHPAVARKLLKKGRAAIYRRYPFTIVLKREVKPITQPIQLKIDPGSKVTGLALVQENKVIWGVQLNHRGQQIKQALEKRRGVRRSRRHRKTRYRKRRFLNRTRPEGWLAPSLLHRVQTTMQGERLGYELREYLLTKWRRQYAYCGIENVPLEIEHIQPKSKGGSSS